jgi:hypothetical protein
VAGVALAVHEVVRVSDVGVFLAGRGVEARPELYIVAPATGAERGQGEGPDDGDDSGEAKGTVKREGAAHRGQDTPRGAARG